MAEHSTADREVSGSTPDAPSKSFFSLEVHVFIFFYYTNIIYFGDFYRVL